MKKFQCITAAMDIWNGVPPITPLAFGQSHIPFQTKIPVTREILDGPDKTLVCHPCEPQDLIITIMLESKGQKLYVNYKVTGNHFCER